MSTPSVTAISASLPSQALALLPEIGLALIDLLGECDALALMQHAPGQALWIPKRPHDRHALNQVLTAPAFAKLCQRYGDTYLKLPLCKALSRALRNAAIVADYDAGMNRNQLAKKYGLNVRTIEAILPQPTLIDAPIQALGMAQTSLF